MPDFSVHNNTIHITSRPHKTIEAQAVMIKPPKKDSNKIYKYLYSQGDHLRTTRKPSPSR